MKRLLRLPTAMLIVCLLAFAVLAQAQKKPPKKEETQSVEEMMKQLKKEMEADPEMKKAMEEMGMLDMLKQVEKTTKATGVKDVDMKALAAADPNRILTKPSGLPIAATPAGKEQLKAYLQPIMQSTNEAIKPTHKADITPHLNKGKETGEIAMGYFMNKEMDKALYLLLNACLTDQEDYVSINNLAAFMTISGYAHKSLPLLQYLQKHFPKSPTLLNNLGQAWLSLGYLDKAEKFLKEALKEDKTQTQASYSLAVMAKHQGNTAKCVDYVKQTIENGGGTADAIGILAIEDPGTDMAELIRPKYKPYYKKDHAITKRFRLPPVPGSYTEAIETQKELETFFSDLGETNNEAQIIAGEMSQAYHEQRMKIQQDQMRDLTRLMKTPGDAGALHRHYLKYNHPLQPQAHYIIASIHQSEYSTSFVQRMQREEDKRLESEKKLLESLKGIQEQMNDIRKQMGQIEGGEGAVEEEEKLAKMEKQLCTLQQNYQQQFLEGNATIANLYIRNMEDLLNQKLQEEIFWLPIYGYPADPTASVYQAYASYLSGIYSLQKVYPFIHDLSPPCGELGPKDLNIEGKIQQWEADHCRVSWGIDAKSFKGKFDCKGMKMQLNFGVVNVEYGQTTDPATWETTGHTISAEVGAKKEFEVGKVVKGEVGGSVKTTVTIDKGGNIADVTVGGSVGTGISGPIGSAGVELGSVEVSLSGGFNSAGPSIGSPGSSFLRGK